MFGQIKKSRIANWKEISRNWNSWKKAIEEGKVQLGLEGHARKRRKTAFTEIFRCTEMVSGAPSNSGRLSTHQVTNEFTFTYKPLCIYFQEPGHVNLSHSKHVVM